MKTATVWVLLMFNGPGPDLSKDEPTRLPVIVTPMSDWGHCEVIRRALVGKVGVWCVQVDPD
jgi:hypothetical protein